MKNNALRKLAAFALSAAMTLAVCACAGAGETGNTAADNGSDAAVTEKTETVDTDTTTDADENV